MYRPTWVMEAYLNGAWVDITDDVMNTTQGEWGMSGSGPTDFVADVGEMTFDLRNYDPVGKYSPGHANCVSGWKKGVPVRQTFTFKGVTKRIRRYVNDFENAGGKDERKRITALDWLEFAARNPIKNPGILENKRGDEVLTSTLALMPIPPQSTDFDTGINTFPTAFDTVTSKTKAINEFVKTALSELGRVYLVNDSTYGETLVFENAQARNGLRTLTEFTSYASGFLKKADGSYLLKSDGGKIKINQRPVITLHLDNDPSVLDYEIEDGTNILNRFTAYAIPRKIDTSAQVLFRLSAAIPIAAGQTITIRGTYANPDGGLPVNANPDDMINPVATTDYRAFVNSDGSGTEFTANLTVTPSYGTEGFAHSVVNGSAYGGYVTLFNCRGYGIYTYNPIEHQANDSDSQDEYGIISESITQKYKTDLAYGAIYVDSVVDDEREPRTVAKRIYLNGNKDANILMAFMRLDVGNLIRVTEDKSGIDSYYFIQSVSYQTRPGGILMFNWILKPFLCLALGVSALAMEYTGGSASAVDFGNLPNLGASSLGSMTISAWVYIESPISTSFFTIIDNTNASGFNGYKFELRGGAGVQRTIYLQADQYVYPNYYSSFFSNTGVIPIDQWVHIVATYQFSSSATPVFYVNNSTVGISSPTYGSGALQGDKPTRLIVGNRISSTGYSSDLASGADAKLKDVRIYNRILTAAEITTLYNGGTPDMDLVTTGLQFQAFVVPTFRLSSYINATLTSSMKVRDRIYGVVGTPHGTPVGRTP